MASRRTAARVLLVLSLTATGLGASSGPAGAAFHLMMIREVGLDGPAGSDFVELQMYAAGQNVVGGHKLVLYDQVGTESEFTIATNVGNGANQATILFSSSGGPPADFTLPTSTMTTSAGAVCFESSTGMSIDCVEWGTGVGPVSAGNPAPAPPAGGSLERRITPGCSTLLEAGDDTNDSATDFAVQPIPNPESNSTTPNETPCGPGGGGGGGGGSSSLSNLKTKVKGGRAIISGKVQPPAPGQQVKLTFFANGSPLRKVAAKSATLNASSEFKKRFKVPSESTRCKVVVRFQGAKLGQKKFRC